MRHALVPISLFISCANGTRPLTWLDATRVGPISLFGVSPQFYLVLSAPRARRRR